MKTKTFLKIAVVATMFSFAYLGISYSSTTTSLAGEHVTLTSISLTNQAKACEGDDGGVGQRGYCNVFDRCAYVY